MSTSFAFVQRTPAMKTVMREDAVDALGAELALLRVQRVLLVCGGSVRRSPLHGRVLRQLEGMDVLQADDVPAHSSVELVERLARRAVERDIGVAHDSLERIATKTMGERGLYFNPRPVQHAGEILGLLQQAY